MLNEALRATLPSASDRLSTDRETAGRDDATPDDAAGIVHCRHAEL